MINTKMSISIQKRITTAATFISCSLHFFVPCCIVVILMEIQQRKHNKTFFIFLTNPNLHIFTHYLLYTHSHTYKIHITHAHCRNYGLYNYTLPVIPIHALTCDFWVELLLIYDLMNILWITYIAFISR